MRAKWQKQVGEFLPEFIARTPALAAISDDLDVVFHGSTTLGIDDAWSDLDLWALVSEESLAKADALSPTRFYELMLDGKRGHLNLEARRKVCEGVNACDMHRIAELRSAMVLRDCSGTAGRLIGLAQRPMSEAVRRVWTCYHYVEMRSEHRACDTPIERGDSSALLLAMTPALEHALRCAMVIDGKPYPYRKWLSKAARQTPTGARVQEKLEQMLDLLATGALRCTGPEKMHPVSLKLREIRSILVEAAIASGIDEPWLHQWWLWMPQAREGISRVRWDA